MNTDKVAVVFAYHNVGVRSLAVLLARGVRVALVVTHQDDPNENQWFDSVAALAHLEGIPVIHPDNPNLPEVVSEVADCRPDYIFSFYYRHMLSEELLAIPRLGAYNLHGSLLPKYRGRVPINWAVCHGEAETGVTLHQMVRKADAGAIAGQEAVTILPNDTAHQVFQKVVCAGERLLWRILPEMLAGTLQSKAMDLSQGSYFGRRRPEDGRIDWTQGAWPIHNLIRAVAPPYPGAFFMLQGERIDILGSHYQGERASGEATVWPRLYWQEGRCYADCRDGLRLQLTQVCMAERVLDQAAWFQQWGPKAQALLPVPVQKESVL
ncbi:formyltransferase [Candidatus Magnetaquicoccus inordinatus]|uniref:formyltransferase n=1 Tax=Candidatus Magnetaquicoccus inordinatus TaxID=2496818 RepID=UPI00102AD39D|nr:formyltransferase [Candidatus Magnetaquicoccus inordinatus]